MREQGDRGDDTLGSRIGCVVMLPIIWIGLAHAVEEGSHGHVPGGPFTLTIAWFTLCVATFSGLRGLIGRLLGRP